MSETSDLAIPAPPGLELEELGTGYRPEKLRPRKKFEKLATFALRIPGTNAAKEIMADKEKRLTALALGAIGTATTFLEVKGGLQGLPLPFEIIRNGGRHFDVGYLSAMAAASRQRFTSKRHMVGGMLLAGLAGNAATEVIQSVTITGLHHNGWGNVVGLVSPSQLMGNIEDAGVAMAAASYAVVREGMRRSRPANRP